MEHIPDIGKMVSDTPRTDNYYWSFHLLFAEAQKMERELNAANVHIKRLEEAGDALFENSTPSRYDLPVAADRKLVDQSNWTKAKEAKP